MNELTVKFNEEDLKEEARMICSFASDEVLNELKGKTELEIISIGLIHLVNSGELLKQISIHYPRRAKYLPKL